MSGLVEALCANVRNRVQAAVLSSPLSEGRPVFVGPPLPVLEEVFAALVVEGHLPVTIGDDQAFAALQGRKATDGTPLLAFSGRDLLVPVFLLDDVSVNPAPLHSGRCNQAHLLSARNAPRCAYHLALVPRRMRPNLSLSSTTDDFGVLRSEAGQGGVSWADDPFIEDLLREAVERIFAQAPKLKDSASKMARVAFLQATEADPQDQDGLASWRILSRLFCVSPGTDATRMFAAACGFPAIESGILDPESQASTLDRLGEFLLEKGTYSGLDELAAHAVELGVGEALAEFRVHWTRQTDDSIAFRRGPSRFYCPFHDGDVSSALPNWWEQLTVEKWSDLLGEQVTTRGTLALECRNQLIEPVKGMPFIVRDRAELVVKWEGDEYRPPLHIVRSVGTRKPDLQVDLDPGQPAEWTDEEPPTHDKPLKYKIEAPGTSKFKAGSTKVLSLATAKPGIVVTARTAEKATPFRKATKKRGKASPDWVCELHLKGLGSHFIELLHRPSVLPAPVVQGYDTSSESHGEDHPEPFALSLIEEGRSGFAADADEECYFDFEASEGQQVERYRILVSCSDVVPEACRSEFDRLVRENQSRPGDRASRRVELLSSRANMLQGWMIDDPESYRPLVLGDDFLQAWERPKWDGVGLISGARLLHDPRPRQDFIPPPSFLEARAALVSAIQRELLVEGTRLGAFFDDEVRLSTLERYVAEYSDWFSREPDVACWSDVVAVLHRENDGQSLSHVPVAILLTPLHALRIGWQAVAQHALNAALLARLPCPAASVLNPQAAPDLMYFSVREPGGRSRRVPFLATSCNSDYWAVLWNGEKLAELHQQGNLPPFGKDLGIEIDGLANGFSVAQVQKALSDVSRILAAKPTLRISVASGTAGRSNCTEGILQWSRDELVDSADESWACAGPRRLEVFDLRGPAQRPTPAELSNITVDTANRVEWFEASGSAPCCDLSVTAHLGTSNPGLEQQDIFSTIGPGALVRQRIRRQLPAGGGEFLAESRAGVAAGGERDPLELRVANLVEQIENPRGGIDCHVYVPNVAAIDEGLKTARFSVLSSANVDPACFFGRPGDRFLWDYELPAYSRRAADNAGYYLLARPTGAMVESVRRALGRFGPGVKAVPPELVDVLMREVAQRGIPTLRNLSAGGTLSMGEVGVVIACRLLQGLASTGHTTSCIAPVFSGDVVNLVVPVDPFRSFLDDLRRPLSMQDFRRPDLVVASMRVKDGEVTAVRVTPVEVKVRVAPMALGELEDALGQARSLSELLAKMMKHGDEHLLWQIGARHLVASMVDFGFRVYCQREEARSSREWACLHSSAMRAILGARCPLEVDSRGRLMVFDGSAASSPRDLDGDRFIESVVLSRPDGYGILSGQQNDTLAQVVLRLDGWGLSPTAAEKTPSVKTPQAPGTSLRPAPIPTPGGEPTPTPKPDELPPPGVEIKPVPATLAATPLPCPDGVKFTVGRTTSRVFTKRELVFHPSNTNLNQLNVGVVGDLGTGKTQLLKALLFKMRMAADANRGIAPRFLIFDYKKDYTKDDFVQAVGARVVLPQKIPLNPFDVTAAATELNPLLERIRFFGDILEKLYPGIGPKQRHRLKDAVKQAAKDAATRQAQPTIYDVHAQYQALLGNSPDDSLFSILDDLVDMELFERDPAKTVPFSQFLDGVVVIDLAALGQDPRTKNMLVVVMLNFFYEQMLRLEKRPFVGSNPTLRAIDSFLLVDEADNIMKYNFPVLRNLLLQGREFGVGVILASQYLSHFRTSDNDYKEPLLTWFIHKVPNVTVKQLTELGISDATNDLVATIQTLVPHECLYKSLDVDHAIMRGDPFFEVLSLGLPEAQSASNAEKSDVAPRPAAEIPVG